MRPQHPYNIPYNQLIVDLPHWFKQVQAVLDRPPDSFIPLNTNMPADLQPPPNSHERAKQIQNFCNQHIPVL